MVIGAQFGDEAKGKITDYLSADARYVVRTGGGPNAGHSIHLPEASLVLHQLSVGVLRKGVVGISGPGMVIDPSAFEHELEDLSARHLLKGEPIISERAHVILPVHQIEDAWEEEVRAAHARGTTVGTTLRGIGPAYSDRYGRWGIRFADLTRPAWLKERVDLLYATKAHLTNAAPKEELTERLIEIGAGSLRTSRPPSRSCGTRSSGATISSWRGPRARSSTWTSAPTRTSRAPTPRAPAP